MKTFCHRFKQRNVAFVTKSYRPYEFPMMLQGYTYSTNNLTVTPRLANKICLVTGAASGLGEETTKIFVENGATVIGVDIDEKGLQRLQSNYVRMYCMSNGLCVCIQKINVI